MRNIMPRSTAVYLYTLMASVFTIYACQSATAAIVTAVATGTILSGTDTGGVFINKGASLAGMPFRLVFSFDDTKGQQTFASGVSYIQSTTTSNPGVCVMYVNGRTFTYGLPFDGQYTNSKAQRYSAPNSELTFSAGNGPYGDGASVQIGVYPKDRNAITDSNWESAFSSSNIAPGENGDFEISEYPTQVAGGQLSVSTIVVVGSLLSPSPVVFAPVFYVPTGASQFGISPMVASADFNGDGFQDLATANLVDSSLSVLFGDGKGGFAAPVVYYAGAGPYGIAAGDFNGDGKPDLVVVNGLNSGISILLNNGTGGFPSKPSYTYGVGNQPYGVSLADVNRDGVLDLVVTNNTSQTLSVLLGTGTGSFQAAVSYATGKSPFGTAVADLNGDGYPDLVVWNLADNTVGVLLNNKTGKFAAQVPYAAGSNPYGVAVGDFNGDGYPDVAVANLGPSLSAVASTVSVLLNDKTGKLLPAVAYAAGKLPTSVLAADLNGDGVVDLAVTNLGDGTVSLLLGNGDGTFTPQTTVAAGNQPYSILAADFNGDGKLDLAVTSFFDNTFGVLLQTSASASKIVGIPKLSGPPTKLAPAR